MRLEHLTTDEILRMHEPQTELEKILFARFDELEWRADAAENELSEISEQSCGECDDKDEEISGLENTVKALRALLDKHEIDHSEI